LVLLQKNTNKKFALFIGYPASAPSDITVYRPHLVLSREINSRIRRTTP